MKQGLQHVQCFDFTVLNLNVPHWCWRWFWNWCRAFVDANCKSLALGGGPFGIGEGLAMGTNLAAGLIFTGVTNLGLARKQRPSMMQQDVHESLLKWPSVQSQLLPQSQLPPLRSLQQAPRRRSRRRAHRPQRALVCFQSTALLGASLTSSVLTQLKGRALGRTIASSRSPSLSESRRSASQ